MHACTRATRGQVRAGLDRLVQWRDGVGSIHELWRCASDVAHVATVADCHVAHTPRTVTGVALLSHLRGFGTASLSPPHTQPREHRDGANHGGRVERRHVQGGSRVRGRDLPVCGGCGVRMQGTDRFGAGFTPALSATATPQSAPKQAAHAAASDSSVRHGPAVVRARAPDTVICQRCFQSKHYGKLTAATTPYAQFGAYLAELRHVHDVVVVNVVDVADFNGTLMRDIVSQIGGGKRLMLVVNKCDLLPQGVPLQRLEKWVRTELRRQGIPPRRIEAVCFVSARTGRGIDRAAETIRRLRRARDDVYVVGAANVGKSSFVNRLLHHMFATPVLDPAEWAGAAARAHRGRQAVAGAGRGSIQGGSRVPGAYTDTVVLDDVPEGYREGDVFTGDLDELRRTAAAQQRGDYGDADDDGEHRSAAAGAASLIPAGLPPGAAYHAIDGVEAHGRGFAGRVAGGRAVVDVDAAISVQSSTLTALGTVPTEVYGDTPGAFGAAEAARTHNSSYSGATGAGAGAGVAGAGSGSVASPPMSPGATLPAAAQGAAPHAGSSADVSGTGSKRFAGPQPSGPMLTVPLTTSALPGTTLGVIRAPLDGRGSIIDTPGIVVHEEKQRLLESVAREGPRALAELASIKPTKPQTYRMKPGRTLFLGGLARVDYDHTFADVPMLVTWFGRLAPHATRTDRADELFARQVGDLLSPARGSLAMRHTVALGDWAKPHEGAGAPARTEQRRRTKTRRSVVDVCLGGLGWLAVTPVDIEGMHGWDRAIKGAVLTVHASDAVTVEARPPMLPYETSGTGPKQWL